MIHFSHILFNTAYRYKNVSYFTDWIPDGVKTTVCDISPIGFQRTATGVMNTSAIQEVFRRVIEQFTKMFERKAFLHWYQGEGVDESDFEVSKKSVDNLCDEYHVYEQAEVEDEEIKGESESGYSPTTTRMYEPSSYPTTKAFIISRPEETSIQPMTSTTALYQD